MSRLAHQFAPLAEVYSAQEYESSLSWRDKLNGELVARNLELSGRNGRYRALLIRIANALGDSDYRQIAAEINKVLADAGT